MYSEDKINIKKSVEARFKDMVPFFVILAICVVLAVFLIVNVGTADTAPESCETCETCEVCQEIPAEKALIYGALSSWGENIYDSSEYILTVDVFNFGFEEAKNGTLMIRTYSDLVIFSDKVSPNGASFLYPSVSIKFAGVAPLSEKTLIRFLQVETGELLEEPSVGRSTEKEFPF